MNGEIGRCGAIDGRIWENEQKLLKKTYKKKEETKLETKRNTKRGISCEN